MDAMNDLLVVPDTGVIIDKAHNNYILNITDPAITAQIKEAVPFVMTRAYDKGELVLLPVHDDTLRLLRNMKLPTAGMEPLRWQYHAPLIEGEFKAMVHQVTSAAFMASHNRCFNTSTMRTGKTGSVIMCTDYLQSVKGVTGAVLIVATVSNLTGVWKRTIDKTLPNRIAVVVHGGTGKADRVRRLNTPADYYIINYDGVKIAHDEIKAMVLDGRINIVVVDELTHYGNPDSGRFIAMNDIVNKGPRTPDYVYGLTGSPGKNPIPIFGFVKLINPEKLPCKRLSVWQDYTQYRFGRETWQWRNRPGCDKIIFETMQPNIRFDKADIMDLPPVVRQTRDCDLSKEQKVAYKKMREDMMALTQDGTVIEAVHKASLTHKLFQIALGTAIGADKKALIQLDNGPRIATIVEVIKEAAAKVVIFCTYTGVIDRLAKQLKDKGYTVGVVDGRVTGKKRDTLFHDFQNRKDPHILIVHPQTVAFGVELAAADTMIFNGPPLSGDFIYEQALERLSSLKQKARQISIIQIVATEEERNFFSGLDMGVKSSKLVNDLFAEVTKAGNKGGSQ
jgi:SNF2 family DNA or RNA helicase